MPHVNKKLENNILILQEHINPKKNSFCSQKPIGNPDARKTICDS